MKYLIILFISIPTQAVTFKYKNGMTITAPDLRQAAKICYQKLTGGKYIGEEKSLEIIDLCVNPRY